MFVLRYYLVTLENLHCVCVFSNKFHVNFSYNSESKFCIHFIGAIYRRYESVLPRYKMKLGRVVASFSWSIESNNSANVVSMRPIST